MSPAPLRILMVCTANICRSVMAEHFLRRRAAELGVELDVRSCGVMFDGEPASDKVIAVLDEYDLDARDHRSRIFSDELVAGADLVATMERRHARDLTLEVADASDRIHTLGGLTEWLGHDEHRTGSPTGRIAAYAAERRAADLLGGGPDEVADPHGRSKRAHRRTAERLDGLTAGLLDGLYGD